MKHRLCKHCGDPCDCGETRCAGCSICAEQIGYHGTQSLSDSERVGTERSAEDHTHELPQSHVQETPLNAP